MTKDNRTIWPIRALHDMPPLHTKPQLATGCTIVHIYFIITWWLIKL